MKPAIRAVAVARPVLAGPGRSLLALLLVAWLALLSACAVSWVSSYDKAAVDRSTEISKNALGLYQQLLNTEPGKRAAAVNGALAPRYGEIETQIRVHLLIEQARAKNAESVSIAGNLLESWRKFAASHRSGESTALTNATLDVERGILERHLRSAFIAEEAKKLGGGAAK